jgi:hypothetical protein
MLSAYKETDCLYAMVGDYVPGALTAIDKLGLTGSIGIYMSCVDKTSAEYIKDGTIKAGNDGIMLASLIAPTLLQNYLDGHPILDENGKAPHLQTHPFKVDQSNVDAYMAIFNTEGVKPIPDDMLKSLCWRFNPDVTYQTYVDMLTSGLTLEALIKAHGMDSADCRTGLCKRYKKFADSRNSLFSAGCSADERQSRSAGGLPARKAIGPP